MKLKALASVIVVIATVSAVGGSAMAFETPRELVRACRALEAGTRGKAERLDIPFTRPALLCWGYFQAIQDFSVLADEGGNRLLGACPGEEVTSLQLIRSFLAYAGAHENALTGNTALAVISALQDAFPCGPGGPPARREGLSPRD